MENLTQAKTSQKKKETAVFSFNGAAIELLAGISERSREIIRLRYGMGCGTPKTLEKIGNKFNITRERVRQIIQEVLKKTRVLKDNPLIFEAGEKIMFTIKEKNDIIEANALISACGKSDSSEMAAVRFFLEFLGDFKKEEIENELKKSYTLSDFDLEEWKKVKNIARNILESEKTPLAIDEFELRISHRMGGQLPSKKAFDWLEVSEEIKENNFKKWGLAKWEEISPKNTRDKVYLVLRETGKPLHFREIARLIDANKLGKKKTHPQTVHNELIKDKRFVLVGRGTYALSEWGYKRGTVKEVIEEILKSCPMPMRREEILEKILELRQVKKSTVMINLNNFFARTGKNKYTLRK